MNLNLEDFSDEALINELKNRQERNTIKLLRPKPLFHKYVDKKSVVDTLWTYHTKETILDKIIVYTEKMFDDLDAGLGTDSDEHYLYETVLESIYGKDVWTYINKISK